MVGRVGMGGVFPFYSKYICLHLFPSTFTFDKFAKCLYARIRSRSPVHTFTWHLFAKKACGTEGGMSNVVFYWYSLGLPDRQSK